MKKETINKVVITVSFVDFVLFLEKHSALNQYIAALKGKKLSDAILGICPENWTSGVFIWDHTSEGRDFWKALDKKWDEVLFEGIPEDVPIEYNVHLQ